MPILMVRRCIYEGLHSCTPSTREFSFLFHMQGAGVFGSEATIENSVIPVQTIFKNRTYV